MTQEDYDKLTKEEKIELAADYKTPVEVLEKLFYENDNEILFNVASNHSLPLGKLKRLRCHMDVDVRQMALEMYEQRLIY